MFRTLYAVERLEIMDNLTSPALVLRLGDICEAECEPCDRSLERRKSRENFSNCDWVASGGGWVASDSEDEESVLRQSIAKLAAVLESVGGGQESIAATKRMKESMSVTTLLVHRRQRGTERFNTSREHNPRPCHCSVGQQRARQIIFSTTSNLHGHRDSLYRGLCPIDLSTKSGSCRHCFSLRHSSHFPKLQQAHRLS